MADKPKPPKGREYISLHSVLGPRGTKPAVTKPTAGPAPEKPKASGAPQKSPKGK